MKFAFNDLSAINKLGAWLTINCCPHETIISSLPSTSNIASSPSALSAQRYPQSAAAPSSFRQISYQFGFPIDCDFLSDIWPFIIIITTTIIIIIAINATPVHVGAWYCYDALKSSAACADIINCLLHFGDDF